MFTPPVLQCLEKKTIDSSIGSASGASGNGSSNGSEHVVVDKLIKFLNGLDEKLIKLESMLSSNGNGNDNGNGDNTSDSTGIITGSSSVGMRKKLAQNLVHRYKDKKLKMQSKKQQLINTYRQKKSLYYGDNTSHDKNQELETLYKFLKTTNSQIDTTRNYSKGNSSINNNNNNNRNNNNNNNNDNDNNGYYPNNDSDNFDNSETMLFKFNKIFENYYGDHIDVTQDVLEDGTTIEILENLKYISDRYTEIVGESGYNEDVYENGSVYSGTTLTTSITENIHKNKAVRSNMYSLDTDTLVSLSETSSSSSSSSSRSNSKSTPVNVWTQINYHNHAEACILGEQKRLHYYELPFPWRENKYVIHGYRFYASHTQCLKSILGLKPIWQCPTVEEEEEEEVAAGTHGSSPYHWHNETVNIWSHLLSFVYMCFLMFKFITTYQNSNKINLFQKLSCVLFLSMGATCFACSTTWHTFNAFADLKKRSNACCCDYTGISLLITTSIISLQSLVLWNENVSTFTLCSMILAISVLGAITVYMNWSPKFDRPESRPLRIGVFILLAALGNISFVLDSSKGWYHFKKIFGNSFLYYLLGVVFYGGFFPEKFRTDCHVATDIPTHERLCTDLQILEKELHVHFKDNAPLQCEEKSHRPGWKSLWWCDYYLQSHNIWHIAVLLGCLGHYRTLMEIIEEF